MVDQLDDILPTVESDQNNYTREVLKDFWVCCASREASLLSRKEVLTGKAKFGITGDGKEVPQVALARFFKKGDFRSGYYRDQTIIFALGLCTIEDYFAQLYADPQNDPFSGGRQMSSHFATKMIDESGNWTDHKSMYNISSDISSTAGQMARALGLALASKQYRALPDLAQITGLSDHGNEVVFCTIGDASTSEGVFFETMNAAAVLKVPLVMSVWDDGYGISVPKSLQTTKESISKLMEGFLMDEEGRGIYMYTVKGWDYPALCEVYEKAAYKARNEHVPVLVHVQELTQPQGHSTSGSHERYKSADRLKWEAEHDCILQMERWMIEAGICDQEKIDELREDAIKYVRKRKTEAWKAFEAPTLQAKQSLLSIYDRLLEASPDPIVIKSLEEFKSLINPVIAEIIQHGRRLLYGIAHMGSPIVQDLNAWVNDYKTHYSEVYNSKLYAEGDRSALNVPIVYPEFSEETKEVNGFQILNAYFDQLFERKPETFAFGEDVGFIGDVNQGFAGLQSKYGIERIFDTGIREWTIVGQAIGMAMRGLRPIAEIQYLDYLVYAMSPLTDDLATLRYRSNGIQKAPVIIRTRGHRLEGIWHAGSPMALLLASLRGMYICVPRNMTQAAGMYNTLMQADDPAIVVECLNGYRLKERQPDNLDQFTVPLGMPEVLKEGSDVTLVTYGSCVRIAQDACKLLEQQGISVELIDVQTLLPFDLESIISTSLAKTNRIVFLDEDVPGGATAYMMQEVMEIQGGYKLLDAPPVTLTAKAHRPPYGSDGDYFSKPNTEDIFECIYGLMREAFPMRFPNTFNN